MKAFTLFLLTSGLSYALTTHPRSSNRGLIHKNVVRAGPIEPEPRPEAVDRPPPVPKVDPHGFTNQKGPSLEVPEVFHDAVEGKPKYDTAQYDIKGDANAKDGETLISETEVTVGEEKITISVVEFGEDSFVSTNEGLKLAIGQNPDMENAQYSPTSPKEPSLLQRIQERQSLLENFPELEVLAQLESQESSEEHSNIEHPMPQRPTTVVVNTLQHEAHSYLALEDQVQEQKPSIFSLKYWRGTPKEDLSGPTLPLYEPSRVGYSTHFVPPEPDSKSWFSRGIAIFDGFVTGSPTQKRRRSLRTHPLIRRQSAITTIETQEGISASGVTNDTFQLMADFELYLSAFNVAQQNVSELIYPILAEVIDSTNSTLIHEAALSVYSDLTSSAPFVLGPFHHGMNCLTWLEDRFINSSKITNMSDPRIVEMFATDQILLEVYEYMWTNASAAANKTGLLADMVKLSQKLSPTNFSVMPSGYDSYYAQPFDISYFVNVNATANPNNGTSR